MSDTDQITHDWQTTAQLGPLTKYEYMYEGPWLNTFAEFEGYIHDCLLTYYTDT